MKGPGAFGDEESVQNEPVATATSMPAEQEIKHDPAHYAGALIDVGCVCKMQVAEGGPTVAEKMGRCPWCEAHALFEKAIARERESSTNSSRKGARARRRDRRRLRYRRVAFHQRQHAMMAAAIAGVLTKYDGAPRELLEQHLVGAACLVSNNFRREDVGRIHHHYTARPSWERAQRFEAILRAIRSIVLDSTMHEELLELTEDVATHAYRIEVEEVMDAPSYYVAFHPEFGRMTCSATGETREAAVDALHRVRAKVIAHFEAEKLPLPEPRGAR